MSLCERGTMVLEIVVVYTFAARLCIINLEQWVTRSRYSTMILHQLAERLVMALRFGPDLGLRAI
jgi:hypothetical protein